MTSENTFFNRGKEIGEAPMQGLDATRARDALAVKNDDAHLASVESTRNATQINDDNEYKTKRQRGWDADNDKTAAGMPKKSAAVLRAEAAAAGGPAGAGAPGPAMGGATSAPGMAPAGAAAPAAPAVAAPTMSQGDALRRQATQLIQQGKYEAAAVIEGRATAADQKDSFEKGAAMDEQPGVFEAASRLISQKDKSLTFSTDKHGRMLLSIVQPNGKATTETIGPLQRRLILGAQQLMEDGYVEAALGMFAKVSTELAAEVASRNAQIKGVADQHNKVKHEEAQDDSARINANANAKNADTNRTNSQNAAKKESYGNPVEMLDKDNNAVLMQPIRTNGKVSFEKVEMPEGTRFPKQAADRKFSEKSGIFTDGKTGKALSRLDPETGMILPVGEKDIFAGKDGEKKQAEWEDQGVTRGVVEDKDGVAHFAWVSRDDPSGGMYSSPKEALAAGKKGASAAVKPRPESGGMAPRSRGLSQVLDDNAAAERKKNPPAPREPETNHPGA
jgi:hypothetical protein